MKKIIALILALLMVLGLTTTSFASESFTELKSLKIVPNEITQSNSSDLMTREAFSYMAAKLMGSGELKAQTTAFLDVDETNIYSGYIAFLNQNGILSGGGDGNFNPKDPVTVGAASKILTTILDYDALAEGRGGYAGGYEEVARMIGLMKGVAIKGGYLTVENAIEMANNALHTPISSNEYFFNEDGTMSNISQSGSNTILNKILKLSVYSAYVDSVSQKNSRVTATIIENKQKSNPVILAEGTQKTFLYDSSVNAAEFKYTPVTIVVDENETVVSMTLSKNISVKNAVIQSVNGDDNENSYPYMASQIERLTILDVEDEYSVADDAKFYYNESLTTGSVDLIGKPARLVIENDEIVSVESWDLEEGGLITAVSAEQIVYTKGEKSSIKLNKLDEYKNVSVYIDGKSAYISEIKTNSVFDYWASGNNLVIVVSEAVYVDAFLSIGSDELEIGSLAVLKDTDVYYKANSTGFKKNTGYQSLLSKIVRVYLAPNGKAKYVEALDGAASTNNAFLGLLIGKEVDRYEDTIVSVKLMRFKPDVEEITTEINERTRFYDGITRDSFLASANQISSEYVYEFELRADGKVASVKKATWYSGYGATAETEIGTTGTSVVNHFQEQQEGIKVNEKILYIKNQLTLVDRADGKLMAKNVSYSSLVGYFANCKLAFFVLSNNKLSSLPDLIFVYSSTDAPMELSYYQSRNGIIYEKSRIVNEDGDPCIKVTGQFGAVSKTLQLTEAQAAGITDLCFITYKDVRTIDKDDITITQIKDLTVPFDEWPVADSLTAAGWHRGTVETMDEYRLGITDDNGTYDVNFYDYDGAYFLELDISNSKPVVDGSSESELSYGDQVYYNLTADGITGVIIVKE